MLLLREGHSLCCCTICFWVNYTIIHVTKSCAYPVNKQLHALSSALYQKFVYCHFFFFIKSDWIGVTNTTVCLVFFVVLCTYIGANAYCRLIGQDQGWAVETSPGFNWLKPPRSICQKVVNTGQYQPEWLIEFFNGRFGGELKY